MNSGKRTEIVLSGVLGIGLVVGLLFFFIIVNTLESQLYTPSQSDFLSYNQGRIINQQALTANFYNDPLANNGGDGISNALTANFASWENEAHATLRAYYEEQDGVSVTLYDLDFESSYHFEHAPTAVSTTLELIFPFPDNLETLNGVSFLVDGQEPDNVQYLPQNIRWQTTLLPGEEHDIIIRYQANGANSFTYGLNQARRTDKLDVELIITELNGSDIPRRSLPATAVTVPETGSGEMFLWQYDNLVANRDIHLTLPQRLSFTQRIAALQDNFQAMGNLAPLLIILFLGATVVVFPWYQIYLPLPTHLLMGLGFILFYPLITFLSGLVGAFPAALLSAVIIVGLLLLFVKQITHVPQAVYWTAWLLFVLLGVMSLSMLTPWRSLLVTSGGVLLLAGWMVAYVRRPLPTVSEETPEPLEAEPEITPEPEPEVAPAPEPTPLPPVEPARFQAYCPQCGRGLTDDYAFCPGCGYDGMHIHHCTACGHEQVIVDQAIGFCVHCGEKIRTTRK
jgi:hypothetical protein